MDESETTKRQAALGHNPRPKEWALDHINDVAAVNLLKEQCEAIFVEVSDMDKFIGETGSEVASKVLSVWHAYDEQAIVANYSNKLGTGRVEVKYMLENVGAYDKVK
jgi:hypothetical protein